MCSGIVQRGSERERQGGGVRDGEREKERGSQRKREKEREKEMRESE